MTNQGLQIELPVIELPFFNTLSEQKVVGAILACRPRKAKESQNLQKLRKLEDLQRQELEELQQLLVIPLICEDESRNQYVRIACFGPACSVRAEASCLARQTIYIKQFADSLPENAESSGPDEKCDGFLIRRRDPTIVGYRCKSIPDGYFDKVTYAVRRPLGDQESWEVKLNFEEIQRFRRADPNLF